MPQNDLPNTLAEAVNYVLDVQGLGILENWNLFLNSLLDVYDPQQTTPEMKCLCLVCDQEFISYFGSAIKQGADAASLQEAAVRASDMLSQERVVDKTVADSVCGQLMAGIARVALKDSSWIPPQSESTPSPEPTPQPQTTPNSDPQPESQPQTNTIHEPQPKPKPATSAKRTAIGVAVLIIIGILVAASFLGTWRTYTPENYSTVVNTGTELTVSFSNADADGNATESFQMTVQNNELTMPECTFTKEGALFAGWAEDPNSEDGFPPGETTGVYEPTTYYATWYTGAAIEDVTVDNHDTIVGEFEDWASSSDCAVLRVKNECEEPVDLDLNITYGTVTNSRFEDDFEFIDCVAPGQTVCLVNPQYFDSTKPSTASYILEVRDSYSGIFPAADSVVVEETSLDDIALVVQVTNHSDRIVHTDRLIMLATSKEGVVFADYEPLYADIEPQETIQYAFSSRSVFKNVPKLTFEDVDRAYYVHATYEE